MPNMKGRKNPNNGRITKRRTIKSRKHQKHRKTCKKGGNRQYHDWIDTFHFST